MIICQEAKKGVAYLCSMNNLREMNNTVLYLKEIQKSNYSLKWNKELASKPGEWQFKGTVWWRPLTWVFGLYALVYYISLCIFCVVNYSNSCIFCVANLCFHQENLFGMWFWLLFVQEPMIVNHRVIDYPELEGTQGSTPDSTWGILKVKPNV